jgi:hypothetical protein
MPKFYTSDGSTYMHLPFQINHQQILGYFA